MIERFMVGGKKNKKKKTKLVIIRDYLSWTKICEEMYIYIEPCCIQIQSSRVWTKVVMLAYIELTNAVCCMVVSTPALMPTWSLSEHVLPSMIANHVPNIYKLDQESVLAVKFTEPRFHSIR